MFSIVCVAGLIWDVKADIIEFANKHLEEKQPQDDYREFLELALIFLGEIPPRGVCFMAPGAMHHARWMSKVIYSLTFICQPGVRRTPNTFKRIYITSHL